MATFGIPPPDLPPLEDVQAQIAGGVQKTLGLLRAAKGFTDGLQDDNERKITRMFQRATNQVKGHVRRQNGILTNLYTAMKTPIEDALTQGQAVISAAMSDPAIADYARTLTTPPSYQLPQPLFPPGAAGSSSTGPCPVLVSADQYDAILTWNQSILPSGQNQTPIAWWSEYDTWAAAQPPAAQLTGSQYASIQSCILAENNGSSPIDGATMASFVAGAITIAQPPPPPPPPSPPPPFPPPPFPPPPFPPPPSPPPPFPPPPFPPPPFPPPPSPPPPFPPPPFPPPPFPPPPSPPPPPGGSTSGTGGIGTQERGCPPGFAQVGANMCKYCADSPPGVETPCQLMTITAAWALYSSLLRGGGGSLPPPPSPSPGAPPPPPLPPPSPSPGAPPPPPFLPPPPAPPFPPPPGGGGTCRTMSSAAAWSFWAGATGRLLPSAAARSGCPPGFDDVGGGQCRYCFTPPPSPPGSPYAAPPPSPAPPPAAADCPQTYTILVGPPCPQYVAVQGTPALWAHVGWAPPAGWSVLSTVTNTSAFVQTLVNNLKQTCVNTTISGSPPPPPPSGSPPAPPPPSSPPPPPGGGVRITSGGKIELTP